MPSRRIVLILIASITFLAVEVAPRLAATGEALPTAPELAAGGTTIPYAGRLTDEQGRPATEGAYDLAFTLYDVESGGEPIWSEVQEGVRIAGGALSTALGATEAIPPTVLDGQPELWLAVSVRGPREIEFTALEPRQWLSAEAPTAPASTSSDQACAHDHLYEAWVGTDPLRTLSIANHGDGDGIWGSALGSGAGAGVHGMSWNGAGVKGSGVNGRGVEGYSSSTNEWVPAVYGSHDGAGDGVYGVSQNRHGLYGVSKSLASDSAGVYARNDGNGAAIHSDGDLYVTGAFVGNLGGIGGAPFPRPAWDSLWRDVNAGECRTIDHNLGGNESYYVVDLQFRDATGIHVLNYGSDSDYPSATGGYYTHLTNQQIILCKASEAHGGDMRVRIWLVE
jgi:hypothetical protein